MIQPPASPGSANAVAGSGITGTAGKRTKKVIAEDLDQDGTAELVMLHDAGVDVLATTDGATWTIAQSIAAAGFSAATIEDVDGDRSKDIVIGSASEIRVLFGDAPPLSDSHSAMQLSEWGARRRALRYPRAPRSKSSSPLISTITATPTSSTSGRAGRATPSAGSPTSGERTPRAATSAG